MNKLFLALALIVGASVFASAQTDYTKGEFFGGYSNGQIDTGADTGSGPREFFEDRTTFHGFEAAGVYNVSRYVGIKGDVSGTYNTTDLSFPVTTGTTTQTVTFRTKNSLYNVLGGIQIRDNANEGRFKPFAHILGGLGHGRVKVSNVNCTTTTTINCGEIANGSESGIAGAFGGGIDIRLNDKVDFRAIQVDYNPIKFDGGVDHNARFSVGFVIK
jgi:hypothetical protein